MANVVILGGGFAGVVAAESLAKKLGHEHQITLVSQRSGFVFYPALVRLAFKRARVSDISFDVREAMLDRRVRFVQAQVAHVNPQERRVRLAGGEFDGELPYDFLIFALGRRLATERIRGFFEHANHLLDVEAATKFGAAAAKFDRGRAIIGHCLEARLPVPAFETAFALSRDLKQRGVREQCSIEIVSGETPEAMFGVNAISQPLRDALTRHQIEFVSDFPISHVNAHSVIASDGRSLEHDLLMLIPPFAGSGAAVGMGITDTDGFIKVESTMRVPDVEGMYAAGDCISFPGPKLGHMAVRQAEVAAENLADEIDGKAPRSHYDHEMMLVIDEGGKDSLFLRQDLWYEESGNIKQGRFWSLAKRLQETFWKRTHA
jgi:NADH dehydrogenase FAD-containing subunit